MVEKILDAIQDTLPKYFYKLTKIREKQEGHRDNSARTYTFAISGEGVYKITIERVS